MANGENEETRLTKIEETSLEKMSLEQRRRAEQLYNQMGLDPIVEKVLDEFNVGLTRLDRVTDKVFGVYDVKGRAEAVAKITALVTYASMSEQFNKEMNNMHAEMQTVQNERDHVRNNYDSLVEKVADVVGGDYDELKEDYNEIVDKLSEVDSLKSQIQTLNQERSQLVQQVAKTLGEDYEDLKNNYSKLVEKIAEIEHLRAELADSRGETAQQKAGYESKIANLAATSEEEQARLSEEIQSRDTTITRLETEKKDLNNQYTTEKTAMEQQIATLSDKLDSATDQNTEFSGEIKKLSGQLDTAAAERAALTAELGKMQDQYECTKKEYDEFRAAIKDTLESLPVDDLRVVMAKEMHDFVLKDSKVPAMVLDGVGKFIDFEKYLGFAIERGLKETIRRVQERI